MLVLEPQLCLICLSKCSHSLWFAAPLSWVAHPIVGSSFQVFSSFWQPVFIIRCRNIVFEKPAVLSDFVVTDQWDVL